MASNIIIYFTKLFLELTYTLKTRANRG